MTHEDIRVHCAIAAAGTSLLFVDGLLRALGIVLVLGGLAVAVRTMNNVRSIFIVGAVIALVAVRAAPVASIVERGIDAGPSIVGVVVRTDDRGFDLRSDGNLVRVWDSRTPVSLGEHVRVIGRRCDLKEGWERWRLARGYGAEYAAVLVERRDGARDPILAHVANARTRVERALAPSPQKDLLLGMVLGEGDRLASVDRFRFRESGTGHLLAVSGLHVGAAAAGAMAIARVARLGRFASLLLGVMGGGFLCLVSQCSPSAVRAFLMLTTWSIASALGRGGRAIGPLALAVVAMIVVQPFCVLDWGFLLSVASVAAILFLFPAIRDAIVLTPRWVADGIGLLFAVSIAVIPLSMAFFGRAAIAATAVNVICVPIAGIVVPLALIAVGVSDLRPLAHIVLTGATAGATLLKTIVGGAIALPGASTGDPLVATAAVMTLVCLWIAAVRGKRVTARVVVGLLLVPVVLGAIGGLQHVVERPPSLVAIDVGQGDATILRTPRGRVVLVDAGPDTANIAALLRDHSVASIDVFILTHIHDDHADGADEVLGLFPVALFLSAVDPESTIDDEIRALARAREVGVEEQLNDRSFVFVLDNTTITVFSPPTGSTPNERSLVVEFVTENGRGVILGDLEETGQRALLDCFGKPVEVVRIAHHGSEDAYVPEMYEQLMVDIAIISAGSGNPYGHPSPVVLEGLASSGIKTFRTDRDGSVTVRFHRDRLEVTTSAR